MKKLPITAGRQNSTYGAAWEEKEESKAAIQLVVSGRFRASAAPAENKPFTEIKARNDCQTFVYVFTHLELAKLPLWLLSAFSAWLYNKRRDALSHPFSQPLTLNRFGVASVPYYYQSVLDGASYVTEWLWPTAFTSLLLHDFITYYTQPEKRYGTTLSDIFLGTASNQLGFSSTYGTDIPTETLHGLVPLLPGLAIAAFSGLYLLYDDSKSLSNAVLRDEDSLRRLRYLILWAPNKSIELRRQALNRLIEMVQGSSSRFMQIEAVRALHFLEQIASSMSAEKNQRIEERNSHLLQPGGEENMFEAEAEKSLSQLAQEALVYHATKSEAKLTRGYAHYLLWSRGEALTKKAQGYILPFSLLSLTIFFSKMRLVAMWWRKSQELANYLAAKKACEKDAKVYSYTQSGNYECSLCGDWPFVYYGDIQTMQGCLNGLLNIPHSAPFLLQQLQAISDRLKRYPKVSTLDLSKQPWAGNWTEREWDQFLNGLENVTDLKLTTLNLSAPTFSPGYLQDNKMQRLASFFKKVPVNCLDISYQNIRSRGFNFLLAGIQNNTQLIDLHLAGTRGGDRTACALANILPMTRIVSLKIGDNNITDKGLSCLNAVWPQVKVADFSVSNNPLTETSLLEFIGILPNTPIKQLDLSGMALSAAIMDGLGRKLSVLSSLQLSHCQLHDEHLINWPQYARFSRTQFYDFSDNFLSRQSVFPFLENLPDHQNLTINLEGLEDFRLDGAKQLSQLLLHRNIVSLDISRTNLKCSGFSLLTANISYSRLHTLFVSKNRIEDSCMATLMGALAHPFNPLKHIDLSYNKITPKGSEKIFSQLPESRLKVLNVEGNQLSGAEFVKYPSAVNSSQLAVLNVAHNPLATENIPFVLRAIVNNTRIENLAIGNVDISDQDSQELAKQLIPFVPHFERLSQAGISQDQQRWLHAIQSSPAHKTPLGQLSLSHTKITTVGARTLCHIAPVIHLEMTHLDLSDNAIDSAEVNIANCQISAASRNEPLFIFKLFHLPPILFHALSNFVKSMAHSLNSAQPFDLSLPARTVNTFLPSMSVDSYPGSISTIKVIAPSRLEHVEANGQMMPTLMLVGTLLALGLRRWTRANPQ